MASNLDDEDVKAVAGALSQVASICLSVRAVLLSRVQSGTFDGRDEVMLAALEKAGALCDSQSLRLGGNSCVTVGGFDQWVALKVG